MKIISNFKDYYDYLQGVYGIDEKIVFVRKKENFVSDYYFRVFVPRTLQEAINGNPGRESEKLDIIFTFAFCNELHIAVFNRKNNKLFFDNDAIEFLPKHIKEYGTFPKFTNLNIKKNQPILLANEVTFDENNFYPISMQDWGINKLISAHDAYVSLSTWLSREKFFEDQRTDEQKIVGHGFDKVFSFRNKK